MVMCSVASVFVYMSVCLYFCLSVCNTVSFVSLDVESFIFDLQVCLQSIRVIFYMKVISQLPNLCTGIRRICMWVRSVSRCYRP